MGLRLSSRRPFLLTGLAGVTLLAACANDFDTTRSPAPRGTIGEELYGVLCDRVGAQALHEDLTGGSFKGVCHKDATGAYADKVDDTTLPPAVEGAVDREGNVIPVDQQNANRAHALARIGALVRRRGDLIAALDATFPDVKVPIKDIKNSDPTHSCDAPKESGERQLADELADMLGRMTELYNDGTLPQSTQSLARIFDAIKASPEAQQSLARFEGRQGYRPLQLALGAARPAIAYPNLRDLSNAMLAIVSADSQPYELDPKRDDSGRRIPVPGPGNAQFSKLLEVAHHELLFSTKDKELTPLGDLAVQTLDASNRTILPRERSALEILQEILYAQDPAFGTGMKPSFIVKRDAKGYALAMKQSVKVPAPFTDADHNLVPDTDTSGHFIMADNQPSPTPFFTVGQTYSGARDLCGRLLRPGVSPGAATADAPCGNVKEDDVLYRYIDTSHVFAASLMADLKPLTNPDPKAKHETLMYAFAGSQPLFGAREAQTKCYSPDKNDPKKCADPASLLAYDGFKTSDAALLDLVYAFGQLMGDPSMDDTLHYVRSLFRPDLATSPDHIGELARIAGAGLQMKEIADKHPEAKIPAATPLWDEMLDIATQIAQEPGLLEDVLRALGNDASQNLGKIFSNYMNFRDEISYNNAADSSGNALNGPPLNKTTGTVGQDMKTPVDRSQPDTGFNRSGMQRFLQLIHDTNGVTACNKDKAIVHANIGVALDLPLDVNPLPHERATYKECEVFKIENLAKFYLDSIVGEGHIYFRPDILRNGVAGIGAATVKVIEDSSGLRGFWDKPDDKIFRPKPQWLNRLVFFDQATDQHAPTQKFLADLQGPHIGTQACAERVIDDPVTNAPDTSSDKKVHGLRACKDGEWLDQRGKNSIFVWEQFGFYESITPLLKPFVLKHREDLFIGLMEVLNSHWASDKTVPGECLLSQDPKTKYKQCSKAGVVSYEPLLVEQFATDIIPALHDFEKTLEATSIDHCESVDAAGKCVGTPKKMDGIAILAQATRALLDPALAKKNGLLTRKGAAEVVRNDGTANAQVTPIYLLIDALKAMDTALEKSADKDRMAQWRLARSQLVDQFLGVDGTGKASAFRNAAFAKITPRIVDVLREQLFEHCPQSFNAPFARCDWARDQMVKKVEDVVKGPTFAATIDLVEQIRKDDNARIQTGLLMQYLLDAASKNDALPGALASMNDMVQLLSDDENLVPLFHVLAPALEKTQVDEKGQITKKSLVDAQLALLARMSGRAFDTTGTEICANEIDPNQVITAALAHVVTPMVGPNGQTGQTPLQVIMDVIGDVNRAAPETTGKFAPTDYASISDNVSDFLLNKERGLEQFYEIVRQGTER
jgi:hypothetical protein